MSRNIISVIVVLILLTGGWIGFVVQKQRHEETMESERSRAEEWALRLENATNQNAELRERAERIAAAEASARKRAEEAKRLAELKVREEEEKRKQRIAELNERLLQEAEDRRRAEDAMNTLSAKMQQLAKARATAEERLAALAAASEYGGEETQPNAEVEKLRAELREKEASLKRLAMERREMEERYQDALARQSATATEIIEEGRGTKSGRDLLTYIVDFIEYVLSTGEEDSKN